MTAIDLLTRFLHSRAPPEPLPHFTRADRTSRRLSKLSQALSLTSMPIRSYIGNLVSVDHPHRAAHYLVVGGGILTTRAARPPESLDWWRTDPSNDEAWLCRTGTRSGFWNATPRGKEFNFGGQKIWGTDGFCYWSHHERADNAVISTSVFAV